MALAQENNNTSPGIKLFGATITLKQISRESNDDHRDEPKKSDDQDDPTVEKRPHKIIPCPRCKSVETKFCYFNNYNVNQPRHFCKGCQRYWTAGGALRNVPIGAGRRKVKPPCRGLSAQEGCLFDASGGGIQQLDFDAVAVQWRAAEHGGFGKQHLFPGKPSRFAPR